MQTPLQWPHLLPLAQARDVSRKLNQVGLVFVTLPSLVRRHFWISLTL